MPLFVYRGEDGPRGLELRKTVRPLHLEHLQQLVDAGRVKFAGPLIDDSNAPCGSIVIFEADDLAGARGMAESDPYWTQGVFERVDVQETKAVLP